jgi:hypothetical protein
MAEELLFDLELYNSDPYVQNHEKNATWAILCDNSPVIMQNNIMICKGFIVNRRWCIRKD